MQRAGEGVLFWLFSNEAVRALYLDADGEVQPVAPYSPP